MTTTRGDSEVDGVPVHRIRTPLAPGAGIAISPGVLGEVERLIRREAFDVVHAHASVVSPVAFAGSLVGHLRGGLGQVNIADLTPLGAGHNPFRPFHPRPRGRLPRRPSYVRRKAGRCRPWFPN